ncbi:MAG: ChaN family lipoprotein [Planctomycetota bacterium]
MRRWFGLVVLIGVVVGGVGCRAGGPDEVVVEPAVAEAVVDPESLVMRYRSGPRVTLARMVEAGARAEVLVVGETHGNLAGRAWTRAFWEAVRESREDAVLSLEFLERDQQRALDDAWLFGKDWPVEGSMGFTFPLAGGGRVIASNAPRRYVSAYRKEGLAFVQRMTPEQRRLVVVPEEEGELPMGRYAVDFENAMRSAMAGHGGGEAMSSEALAGFYRAQLMWDATMADSIVRALADGHGPVVHVVGRFHSDFGGGLRYYLRRFLPGVSVMTVSLIDAEPPEDWLRGEDRFRADFVVYLRPRGDEAEADE